MRASQRCTKTKPLKLSGFVLVAACVSSQITTLKQLAVNGDPLAWLSELMPNHGYIKSSIAMFEEMVVTSK